MNADYQRKLFLMRKGYVDGLDDSEIKELGDLDIKIQNALSSIQFIDDMMIDLEIEPPLELWLANSKTWKAHYDSLSNAGKYNECNPAKDCYCSFEKQVDELKQLKFKLENTLEEAINRNEKLETECDNLKAKVKRLEEQMMRRVY